MHLSSCGSEAEEGGDAAERDGRTPEAVVHAWECVPVLSLAFPLAGSLPIPS